MFSLIQSLMQRARGSKLLSRSAIYALGDLMTKGAKYITLPIFVACLTVSELGQYSVLLAVTMICWAVTTLGFGAAVRRYYAVDGNHDDLLIKRLWMIRLFIAAVPAAFLAIAIWMFGDRLFPSVPISYVLVALATGYLRAGTDTIESWFIIREEPVKYRTFTFLKFLSTTAIVLLLVVALGWGVYGAVLGECIGAAIWCIVAGIISQRSPSESVASAPSTSTRSLKSIFRYSLPIIPHALCLWMLVNLDRIILQKFIPTEQIGVYEIAYVYASLLIVVASAINAAWLPDFFRTADQQDGPARFSKTADLYFIAVFVGACALSIFAPDVIVFLKTVTGGDATYLQASRLSQIVLIGVCLQGLFLAFSQPLFYNAKTITLALVSSTGVAVNVAANIYLIPRMGTTGAAWATAIAYGAMCCVILVIIRQTYRIPWNYFGLVGSAILFACLTVTAPFGSEIGLMPMLTRAAGFVVVAGLVFALFRFSRRLAFKQEPIVSVAAGGESV